MGTFDYASKIQGLLANAEDEGLTDGTRANYRAKAEELMVKYRVAEEELLATDEGAASPIKHEIVVCHRIDSPMRTWYTSVFSSIARHTGVRYLSRYTEVPGFDGPTSRIVATVVGYEGDVRYTEFLWTAALLMFSTRIDPTWSPDRSESENIFLLRNAGIERRKIADMAWGNGTEAAARSKVQRIYIKEAARRGEEARATGLSHNTSVYRTAYARSFRDTLEYRLRDARDAADSVGGGLVLHGRADRVDEAFYVAFPHLRPSDTPTTFDEAAPCAKCAKAKSGHCRDHRPLGWTKADEARWQRMNTSTSALSGATSGRAAAEGVAIVRGHDRAQRLDASGRAIEG